MADVSSFGGQVNVGHFVLLSASLFRGRINGVPGLIRTGGPLLRRQMLYPTELQGRGIYCVNSPSRSGETDFKNISLEFLKSGRRLEREGINNLKELVGADRFELSTSWSQTKRASQLRYAPQISSGNLRPDSELMFLVNSLKFTKNKRVLAGQIIPHLSA